MSNTPLECSRTPRSLSTRHTLNDEVLQEGHTLVALQGALSESGGNSARDALTNDDSEDTFREHRTTPPCIDVRTYNTHLTH